MPAVNIPNTHLQAQAGSPQAMGRWVTDMPDPSGAMRAGGGVPAHSVYRPNPIMVPGMAGRFGAMPGAAPIPGAPGTALDGMPRMPWQSQGQGMPSFPQAWNNLQAQDADHLGFLQSQVAHIETMPWRIVYADIQYPELVPVDRSAWEWAASIIRYTTDGHGEAQPMGQRATDMPLVATTRDQLTQIVESFWVGYDYTTAEMEQARRIPGINLLMDKARVANRIMEELTDDIVLNGRADYGWDSLLNAPTTGDSAVGRADAANNAAGSDNDWPNKNGMEMAADINAAVGGTYVDTEQTLIADTVLLPPSAMDLASRTLISSEFDKTVLAWVRENNIYTQTTGMELRIRVCRGLEDAAAGGEGRLVAYKRDPDVLRLHCPMMFSFDDVFMAGPYRYVVPGMMRCGGLEIRQPKGIRYIDGITA